MKGWGPWVAAENFRQVRQGFEPLEVCLKFDTLKLGIDTKAGIAIGIVRQRITRQRS